MQEEEEEEEEEEFLIVTRTTLRGTHPVRCRRRGPKVAMGRSPKDPHPLTAQPPMTCTIPLPNLDLPRAGRNSPGGHRGVGHRGAEFFRLQV